MANAILIGSFTILTNTDSRREAYRDELLQNAVTDALVHYFESRLKQYPILNDIVVIDVHSEMGCIISAITLGALTAGGGAVYVFVKDYDKIKSNLKLIIGDLKNAYLKITRKKKQPELPPEIEVYRQIPDDLKKYYISAQDTVIYSTEEETVKFTKICVMREDLETSIEENTITARTVHTKIIIKKNTDHGSN